MAQNAHHSGLQPPDPRHVLGEKDLDQPQSTPEQLDVPRDRRNDISDHSGSDSRSQEGSNTGDHGSYQYVRPKLRTLPAWIRSVDYTEDEGEPSAADRLLPSEPGDAIVAQHHYAPHITPEPHYNRAREEGLGAEPERYQERESRWKTFSRTIAYPRGRADEEKQVPPEWLDENMGNYSTPWQAALLDGEDSDNPLRIQRRRQIWFLRLHNNLLRSPITPLILRLTVWCFSLTALALGGSIQYLSDKYHHPQGPSALMAIIVDAVALVYLVYITWDEYTSKPLGLRAPAAKARLILLDIVFIVFDSANLSLAFESLSSVTGACTRAEINSRIVPRNDLICDRQKALASVLLIALIAWLMTFSISVLRLVERVAQ